MAALVLITGCATPTFADVIVSVVNVAPAATNNGLSQPAVQQTPSLGTLPFDLIIPNPTTTITNPTSTTTTSLYDYSIGIPSVTTPGNIVNAAVQNFDLSIGIRDTTIGNLGTIDLGGSGQGGYNDTTTNSFINDTFDSSSGGFLRVNGVTQPITGFPFDTTPVAEFSIPFGSGFLNFSLVDPNAGSANNPSQGVTLSVFASQTAAFTVVNAPPIPQRQPPSTSTTVPEPASFVVFGAAAVGLVRLRRGRGLQLN